MAAHDRRLAATALVALALLASCDSEPPEPTPTSTPSRTPQPTNPDAQAPPVTNPLDASTFIADPCTSLTATQQQEFMLDGGEPSDYAVEGPSCFYDQAGTDVAVSVTYASGVTNGLSYRYAQNASRTWDYWEPAEIDGYPAVGFGPIVDEQTRLCDFAIGISDSLHFWVNAMEDNDGGDYGCTKTRTIASAVLSTIKANQ